MDNKAAIAMINEHKPTTRSCHIDIQHFAIQEWRQRGDIIMHHIAGIINPSDQATKALVGLFTLDMLVNPWDTTNRSNLPFHASICNILTGIHLSSCVDGLDLGRVLLHPNPVFCQSSHECMSQPDRDVI
jgi:hypothetical protein